MDNTELDFLPVSLNIRSKRILIVGGGKVALHKATILGRYTRNITVVSPHFRDGFGNTGFTLVKKEFIEEYLEGFSLVYICTGDRALNKAIRELCTGRGIPASVCDNPALCDFISPAVSLNGHITIAVGSDSRDVKRSIRIRNRIDRLISEGTLSLD